MSATELACAILAGIVGAILIGLLVDWLSELSWASPGPQATPAPEGPAAAEISALIEEARRITREASE